MEHAELNKITLKNPPRTMQHIQTECLRICYGVDGPGFEPRLGARFLGPIQTGSEVHQASCTIATDSFSRESSGRGVALTTHHFVAPRLSMGRTKPLPPHCACLACNGTAFTNRNTTYLRSINPHEISVKIYYENKFNSNSDTDDARPKAKER
jgi:hypothetical protein